jgi:hypothetical protein
LRLQPLRFPHATRARDGRASGNRWKTTEEAHPRDRLRRLARDGPLRARHAEPRGGAPPHFTQDRHRGRRRQMPFAEAAIDVDSVADLELVRAIVARAP